MKYSPILFILPILLLLTPSVVNGFDLDTIPVDSALGGVTNAVGSTSDLELPTVPDLEEYVFQTTSEYEAASNDFLKAMQLRVDELKQSALETIEQVISGKSSSTPGQAMLDDDEKCCNCTAKAAHQILDTAFSHVTEKCSNVTCPFLKKRCDWIAANEKEFKGYLTARLHPGSIGYAYCLGAGECQKPSSPKFAPLDDESIYGEDDSWSVRLSSLVDPFLRYEQSNRTETDLLPLTIDLSRDGELLGRKSHHHCLGKATKYIFRHVLHHIKEACESTEDPDVKKACDWMHEHKEATRGYVYGKVQPWKFAIGYCAHRECPRIDTE